jgi:2-polyprenyl-6-hydroxyphenyl methylase / 3-demethylubiquinone-9 3-methyltransferase
MDPPQSMTAPSSIDPKEVAKFSAMAEDWWDPEGPMAPLHRMNPARLSVIRDMIERHFGLPAGARHPFSGLKIIDVGCGGGMVSEPMARLGARVTGLDASAENIGVARAHAASLGLEVDYQCRTVEELAAERPDAFDVVLNLEVVEHVNDPKQFLVDAARLVRPGGLMIAATLNRTARALASAVIGAEYILRWLPRGTHDWSKFMTPEELADAIRGGGLEPQAPVGLSYHPVTAQWSVTDNLSVNYMLAANRPV